MSREIKKLPLYKTAVAKEEDRLELGFLGKLGESVAVRFFVREEVRVVLAWISRGRALLCWISTASRRAISAQAKREEDVIFQWVFFIGEEERRRLWLAGQRSSIWHAEKTSGCVSLTVKKKKRGKISMIGVEIRCGE
ncbi:hypothetical protein ACLOJK_013414 [Asimina triloba]